MPTNIVQLTPEYFPNSSIGRPLASADIFVGKVDLDPEIVANQKQLSVRQESGTVVNVSQPISTSAGGIPLYLGSPVTLLVEGDYSLKVNDSSGSQVYYMSSLAVQSLNPGNFYYPDYTNLDHGAVSDPDLGAVGNGSSVKDILTEVGAVTKATMYFAHNSGAATTTYVFGTNEAITDNFNIIIEIGALLSPSTGKTLTIDGPLNAGAYQIFSGAGTITISSVILEHDQWRDGAGDDILPSVDNAIDLGSSAQQFKDLYVAGTINLAGLPISAIAAGHLFGLQMSNDTDADHDILIATGEATDSTGTINLKLSTAMTKQIDATWAAGDDAGGMNDGDTVGNGEVFHVFELGNATGSVVDFGYDTSITAAGLLADTAVIAAGLTLYRRIGSVLTDGSANIIAFSQEGNEFLWKDPPLDIDVANQTTSAITRTLTVATGIKVRAIVNMAISNAGTNLLVYLSSLDVNDEAASNSAAPLASLLSPTGALAYTSGPSVIRTNISGQIRSIANANNTTLKIATLGWIDSRGRDD